MLNELFKNPQDYFISTAFDKLMQKRIHKVLLICSSYDAFILEEDGRIDELIFNEYAALNLRYAPQIIRVSTAEKAFEVLETEEIDLLITMLSIGGMDPFSLSKKVKENHPQIPIVALTPYVREVTTKLSREDTSAIDYVFCRSGNSDLLLAIIKLIEDRMNAPFDVNEIGVQAILLVEDSVRFYSSYLSLIYKIVISQSRDSMTEGLNPHQQVMRMRGRPKILLARTYEEAEILYDTYKNNILGIISDVSYSRNNEKDMIAGIKLAEKVKEDNPDLPFLLQSSNMQHEISARELQVGFINKNSKTLLNDLKNYLILNLAFGDFIFKDPETNEDVARASNLKELQEVLLTVPNKSLYYHFSKDHISKWLTARALFSIASVVKSMKIESEEDVDKAKYDLFNVIDLFRSKKGKGIVADFDKEHFDKYVTFSRIGEGSIGGKARGLAFLNTLINRRQYFKSFTDTVITIPKTVVLGVDIFDEFMEMNNLYSIALSENSDEEILKSFVKARLPEFLWSDLSKFIDVVKNPVAVRSSSLLEDGHYQPFAGIYSTYMITNRQTHENMINQIQTAIKCVYASVFFKASKAYMNSTQNRTDEEKMGIVIQEIAGQAHENRFYPTFSGVARSMNFYPIPPEKTENGVANIALGLGKYIVEGGVSLRFSPSFPQNIIQLSSPKMALNDTQKYFYALDLEPKSFIPSIDESVNLLKSDLKTAYNDGSLRWTGSIYDRQFNTIRDGVSYGEGTLLVTFANILKHNTFPLAGILKEILQIGQEEMNQPVEIEFAVDLQSPYNNPVFYLLQIRPIVDSRISLDSVKAVVSESDSLIYSESALGNGNITDIYDVIYVKSNKFSPKNNIEIAGEIGRFNDKLQKENRPYLLIGPGRWGSQDSWLGIPVKWGQISGAKIIVEMGLEKYTIEPSQGTHFFQNLTSLQVAYLTVNEALQKGKVDMKWLDLQITKEETENVRHIRFSKPLEINICGVEGNASVSYP